MTAVLCAALVVFLVCAVSAAFFVLSPSNQAAASFIHSQPGAIHWSSKSRLTMLFVGLDRSGKHATAMSIVSYDPHADSVRMLAIPPSLWVTIPGYGQDRIVTAYTDGGPRLTLQVAQSAAHMVIPYYVAMGPDSFQQLVTSYGGVSVPSGRVKPIHLDGPAALGYLSTGPFGLDGEAAEMQREATLAQATLRAAVEPQNVVQIAALINQLGSSIHTNFPYNQVPSLARSLMNARVESSQIDESSAAVSHYTTGSGAVLLPDWQRIAGITHSLFPQRELSGGKVVVLNGSGAAGAATQLSAWLHDMGASVGAVGSADSFKYTHTLIINNTASVRRSPVLARSVASLLQATIVTRAVPTYKKAPVVVIIGRDYQDLSQQ